MKALRLISNGVLLVKFKILGESRQGIDDNSSYILSNVKQSSSSKIYHFP